ncbi:DUF2737 family protein [Cronobacter dublinensis]|nr:DUF2737 family protein [Cronobacter dublinensis]ELY5818838.1 DUF2737 family protein [Cronobacter dublinensis]
MTTHHKTRPEQARRNTKKGTHPPMPSRDELMKRNSFGSVNNNRYLNRWLGAKK